MSKLSALPASLAAFCALGLFFAASLEALRPLCGGRHATIASDDRTISGTRGPDVIVGGRGPNLIRGGGGNDLICGGYGRDVIYGGRGKDTIDGKKDADLVEGGRGSDEVDGGAGRDEVRGNSGNDTVRGGPGPRDEVDGGMGDDLVAGGDGGFDLVIGGVGGDRIDGGPGPHDVASYRTAGGPIVADLENGAVTGAENEHLVRVEDVVGGSDDDVLMTSELTVNRVDGGPGEDRLLGSHLPDEAFGGPGSDECSGSFSVADSCGSGDSDTGAQVQLYRGLTGSTSVTIAGGDGPDTITVSFRDHRYVVSDGVSEPVDLGDDGVDSVLVSLGGGDDKISFDRSVPAGVSVVVDGGPGSDSLRGGPSDDTLYAGDDGDPDRLKGAGGNDVLFGVNILHPRRPGGAATMVGGAGNDLLVGGQPCEGDRFLGGGGEFDSASFARVRNDGTAVEATIGGSVADPEVAGCASGWINATTEKIEGSPGPDVLNGARGDETLLGRGGEDVLDGRGGSDRCIGGSADDDARRCEYVR